MRRTMSQYVNVFDVVWFLSMVFNPSGVDGTPIERKLCHNSLGVDLNAQAGQESRVGPLRGRLLHVHSPRCQEHDERIQAMAREQQRCDDLLSAP